MKVQVTYPTQLANLWQIGWLTSMRAEPGHVCWSSAGQIAKKTGISGFLDALAMFVRES